MEALGHMVTLCLTFWETARLFLSGCTILHSTSSVWRFLNSPHHHQHPLLSVLLVWHILAAVKRYLVVLICISQMTNDFKHLFTHWPFVYLWRNIYADSLAHSELEFVFSCWLVRVLCISKCQSFIRHRIWKENFFPSHPVSVFSWSWGSPLEHKSP